MKISNINLKNQIAKIEWMKLEPMRKGTKGCPSDKVGISFIAADKKRPDLVDRVIIRIGMEIITLLEWNVGDTIAVMIDKDNLMNFLLVKSEIGNGYKLGVDGAAGMRIQFKWHQPNKLKHRPFTVVDHIIQHDKLIIFEIDQNEIVI